MIGYVSHVDAIETSHTYVESQRVKGRMMSHLFRVMCVMSLMTGAVSLSSSSPTS
jgi:hypothetical protein